MFPREHIRQNLRNCLNDTSFLKLPGRKQGKVRDTYDLGNTLVLVTTDRQSAFDRVLASIPFKGAVLNQVSGFWFEQTKHIVRNHVISIPDPNVTIAEKCKVFPIEFVVRGYLTGSTDTSLTLNNVQTSDAGTYSVVVTNSLGSLASADAPLTVTIPPSPPAITAQPAGHTVVIGSLITLSVTATGYPVPTYQWRKDGVPIDGAIASSLSLLNVQSADAGTYSVVVTNPSGTVTSATSPVF